MAGIHIMLNDSGSTVSFLLSNSSKKISASGKIANQELLNGSLSCLKGRIVDPKEFVILMSLPYSDEGLTSSNDIAENLIDESQNAPGTTPLLKELKSVLHCSGSIREEGRIVPAEMPDKLPSKSV